MFPTSWRAVRCESLGGKENPCELNRMLAFNDPGVMIHAMAKKAAALVTRRSVEELDKLAEKVIPMGIREDLATNIRYAVRWYDAVTVAYERGIRLFIELPPGRTLTDLVTAAFPGARSVAFEQMRIDSLVKLIKRLAASKEL